MLSVLSSTVARSPVTVSSRKQRTARCCVAPALPRKHLSASRAASFGGDSQAALSIRVRTPVTRSVCRSSSSKVVSASAKGFAKMHDFCLTIPYGFIVALGGIMGAVLKGSMKSLAMGGGSGLALCALGFFSLRAWKRGASCTPYTLTSTGLAAGLGFMMAKRYSATGAVFPAGFLAVLSGAMVLFYLYNMIAGGNPPPKKGLPKAA